MIADQYSTPVPHGNHICPELDGLFEGEKEDHPYAAEAQKRMAAAVTELINIIKEEKIDCRLAMGYEVKGSDKEEFLNGIQDMIDRGVYRPDQMVRNDDDQAFKMNGYPYSVRFKDIGQLDLMELIQGLSKAVVEHFGGEVRLGTRFESSEAAPDGTYIVHTDKGDMYSNHAPVLLTGAYHMHNLPELQDSTEIRYTMAYVFGPLTVQDAKKISKDGQPMAIGDTNMLDVRWGGLDAKRYLTFGRGDLDAPQKGDQNDPEFRAQVSALKTSLDEEIKQVFPGLLENYKPNITLGPMLMTDNQLPVVMRGKDYDAIGAWSGTGIAAAWAVTRDYADYLVTGNDEKLRFWESLQPAGRFTPTLTAAAHKAGTVSPPHFV
jgi:glycine/D-amino acid oxidase-like deaminating enzyme